MCAPVCGVTHLINPFLLTEKSSGSGLPVNGPTQYNRT